MSTVERLSGIDRAWLLMDRPANPMTIVGLIVLGERLAPAPLREIIARRLLAFHRFRCVPVADTVGASWVESPSFSLEDHVLPAALPAPAGQRELEALAGELASTPFPPGRPRWSFHLVERYGGGSAIIVRVHHCYADGIALVQVLLSLGEPEGGATAAGPVNGRGSPATRALDAGRSAGAAGRQGEMGLVPQVALDSLQQAANLLEAGLHYALHPAQASSAAREALAIGGELARLAALPDDPPTRLRRALSGSRRLAWARALSLEEVHTVGRVLGCTVNDVLISTLAGALRRYLESGGEAVDGLAIRATVPVNLRPAADAQADTLSLGNRFGLVFVELPIGIRHPLERLYAVHAAMQALKASPQALATLGLLSLVGSLPPAVETYALGLFSAKASLVASSLPGPAEPLALAGRRITEVLFWVPQSGTIGTGVSMLTYCGRVQYGVMADRALIPDPLRLVELLAAEFERLLLLVLLGAGPLTAASTNPSGA